LKAAGVTDWFDGPTGQKGPTTLDMWMDMINFGFPLVGALMDILEKSSGWNAAILAHRLN